eukprot:TRINITY_DN48611_c0_g1_i1.p1 TRINITY_DN48611_c0_g1~~TRINITY_DN48611_c0_g1_i1.p1  ORF type:complete len:715 (-),score=171.14 TRINITY_DN48611_c0_g1_i1:4-2073(-)
MAAATPTHDAAFAPPARTRAVKASAEDASPPRPIWAHAEVASYLTGCGVLRLALTCGAGQTAFRPSGRWLFRSLSLDGDRAHNPNGIFASVVVEKVEALSVANLGVNFMIELASQPLEKLSHLTFIDCLFEAASVDIVARVVAKVGVRELTFRRCFLTSEGLTQLAAASSQLQRFEVAEAGLRVPLSKDVAVAVIASGTRELVLRGAFALDAPVMKVLGSRSSLRSLQLLDNPLLDDEAVHALCESLARNASASSLTSLDLSTRRRGALTDAAALSVAHALSSGVAMRCLRLAGHKLSRYALATCLECGRGLKRLDFAGNVLGSGADVQTLSKAAVGVSLVELHVGRAGFEGCAADDEGKEADWRLASLAWTAPFFPSLVLLDCRAAWLDDTALLQLTAALLPGSGTGRPQMALRSLSLAENLISHVGIAALLDALSRGGARLRSLDLGINQLGDEGCDAVAAALRPGGPLEELRWLSLRANSLSKVAPLGLALERCGLATLDLRENLLADADARLLRSHARRQRGGVPAALQLCGNDLSPELLAELNGTAAAAASGAEVHAGIAAAALPPTSDFVAAIADASEQAAAAAARAHVAATSASDFETPSSASARLFATPPEATTQEDPVPKPAIEAGSLTAKGGRVGSCAGHEDLQNSDDRHFEDVLRVSGSEWQDCVDSIAWMESQLIRD